MPGAAGSGDEARQAPGVPAPKPGRNDHTAYMPAPNNGATVSVVHTGYSRMIRGSVSGCSARDSATSHAANSTRATPNSPST